MRKSVRKLNLRPRFSRPTGWLMAFALTAFAPVGVQAQSVVFPQEQQAGTARLSESGDTYTLSNDLLSASFVKNAGGQLLFGGCEAMNLKAGSPLFRVVLGGGMSFTSSEMTLESVTMRDLTADKQAAKGSERFAGKALEAVFTHGNLRVTWQAVLRDGSHYLRTEMDITATDDQRMQSITPMIYDVDVLTAGTVPVKVGNTRGAVLASDKIFAGLETPMGVNSALISNTGFDVFTPKAWTPESFVWTPGEETPSEILNLTTTDGSKNITSDGVVCARGYVSFRTAGEQTLTFRYKSGNHRLNIVGVDVVDGTGKVIASDYHVGFAGGQLVKNVYKLNIPETGAYVLRYFAETITESIDSRGEVDFSGRIAEPVVLYDLVGDEVSVKKANRPADSDIYDQTQFAATADGYTQENGCGEPSDIVDGDKDTYWHSDYKTDGKKAMPHWFMVDMRQSQPVRSLGFTARQVSGNNAADATTNGQIKEYEIWTGDDSNQLTKQKTGTLPFTLREQWINLDETVNARYVKVVVKSSQNGREFAAIGEFRISKGVSADQPLSLADGDSDTDSWEASYWTQLAADSIPGRVKELGHDAPNVYKHETPATILTPRGTLKVTFQYASGNNRLQIVGVDLLDHSRDVVASDYHFGTTGTSSTDNTYTLGVPNNGNFTLRYIVSMKDEANTSAGSIALGYEITDTLHMPAPVEVPIEGYWKRPTTLKAGKTWNVSAVVGLVAPGQQRRSFLAYSERERAVAWRPMTIYNSWYELNIDRNNAAGNGGVYGKKGDYTGNYTSDQCVKVLNQWKTQFYDKYQKAPVAFVWDDGWDEYGTWTFNGNFPQGFAPEDKLAKEMNSGIGTWLGPVGGYGTCGNYRRNYWSGQGGMQLSNQKYYDYFVSCCDTMIKSYEFRFFKFDGISSQFSSVGPDLTDTGLENAEAIIQIERDVRKLRPDIFYNTTVGTWASPFWYHYTDATWRQENDYGTIGVGTDREKWITYRDRLVYQNYVQNSPLCPINTLMTHGLILSSHGNVSKDMDYSGIVREMRCAFGCGSAMVELYVDYERMNNIQNSKKQKGMLWKELSDCMAWQERNADVLPDIHWVGGNPWDGSKANIYGWAAWNGKKVTLTLRNGSTSAQTLTTTLRRVFDIPDYINTTITLKTSFEDQKALGGLETEKAIDIDQQLNINMPASTVYVFEGVDDGQEEFNPVVNAIEEVNTPVETVSNRIYNLAGQQLTELQRGVNIVDGKKIVKK